MASAGPQLQPQQQQQQPQQQQQQQFCVRWNSYQSNLQNAFPKLLTSEHFVDVTLACESEMIKCHKVVLSACSTYFEKLLVQNPCQHPIIFMKDMRFMEMQALVDFMYKGEVNVTQDELPSLLRSAEALQIRGLCGSDQLLNQHCLGALQASKGAAQPAQCNGSAELKPQSPGSVTGDKKTQEEGGSPAGSEHGMKLEPPCSTLIKKEPPAQVVQHSSESNGSLAEEALEQSLTIKEDFDGDESYYDGEGELMMDAEYMEQDEEDPSQPGTSGLHQADPSKTPEFAIANVSCQYSSSGDGSPGLAANRRIRRSEAELRRAAECITRGQTFQTVSDQFNIPISTIRFYMARKGILPRRKRGRACSVPNSSMGAIQSSAVSAGGGFHGAAGNTSPVGPPYHIVHYKLPVLGAKLK